jgi:hypothetical protein
MPTTTRQYTAECQLLGKIWPRNATDRTVPLINFPRNATNPATVLSPWHSAIRKLAFRGKIWARNLAKDWIPVPAILHQQLPCLLRHNFSTHDFPAVKPWRGKLFRPKLYTKGPVDTPSRDTIPLGFQSGAFFLTVYNIYSTRRLINADHPLASTAESFTAVSFCKIQTFTLLDRISFPRTLYQH